MKKEKQFINIEDGSYLHIKNLLWAHIGYSHDEGQLEAIEGIRHARILNILKAKGLPLTSSDAENSEPFLQPPDCKRAASVLDDAYYRYDKLLDKQDTFYDGLYFDAIEETASILSGLIKYNSQFDDRTSPRDALEEAFKKIENLHNVLNFIFNP